MPGVTLDRIVPDSIRALQRGAPIPVRNKNSTRPWQHVLEPLSGYLTLAAALSRSVGFQADATMMREHFGPDAETMRLLSPGTRHNGGEGIRMALAVGADRAGDWNGMHAEPVDAATCGMAAKISLPTRPRKPTLSVLGNRCVG